MEFLLLLLIPYLLVGMKVARNDYALRSYQSKASGLNEAEYRLKLKKAKVKFDTIGHSGLCNMMYSGLRSCGCDCSQQRKWLNTKAEVARMEYGIYALPEPDYKMIPFWWVYLIGRYIKSGEYKPDGYDPELTARLEREAGILE